MRYGEWKYHRRDGRNLLYNLKEDVGETKNIIENHPEIVKELMGYFNAFEKELGKGSTLSAQCRPAGYVDLAKTLKK